MSKKSRAHDERLAENLRQISLLFDDKLISLYPEGLDDRIICPLCWRSFHIDENAFTDEHVPAKSANHVFTTRTCEACNSKAGHSLEEELRKHNEYWNVLGKQPNSSFRAFIKYPDLDCFVAKISIDAAGKPTMAVDPKKVNPSIFERLQAIGFEGSHVLMNAIDGGNERYAKIALLKAAYLAVFRYFGYGYLFSSAYPALQLITQQIANPEASILPDFGMAPITDDADVGLVNLITSPASLYGFLVVFDLRLQPSTANRIGVMLPSAVADCALFYETSKTHVGTHIPITFYNLNKIHLPDYLKLSTLAIELCQLHAEDAAN